MWSVVARCIASGIFAVYGLFCLSSGLACFFNVNALLQVAQPGQAVVEQSPAGKQIVWHAPDGKAYAVAPGVAFSDYAVNERVDILYHPENPGYWKIDSFAGLRLWGLVMDITGIALLAIALAILPKKSGAQLKERRKNIGQTA